MGVYRIRIGLLLVALLFGQSLAFAHDFDHPLGAHGGDVHCLSCVHGHFGGAPLPAVVSCMPDAPAADGYVVVAARRPAAGRPLTAYRSRAPPGALV